LYQPIARKWRPKRFDEIVGQKGVTQTLRNAIATGRVAPAYVFAGARGVGKTTTARILARALNCERGPTPDPCGRCDMCVEIAEGRDLDVLEIDAATHTGVDNVRDVIIDGLAIRPVRDRYKIFIIDEVHQLSSSSFNALLKSIEEPPPHVVFMMATTELHKIPDTITSRSQVFEFRTIGTRPIAEQLRRIADAEGIEIDDEALALLARAADGSMRDAQSALDQVLAFDGARIDARQVSEVLGLVGRDVLLDLVDIVAAEDASRVFDIAARIIESGHDLRHVCRELARLVRDLMILQIDPARASDRDFAIEGDIEQLRALAAAFSREDLLRAFDLIANLEDELRFATQPRYHLEMALLRWIHLRKLVPLSELIDSLGGGGEARGRSGGPDRSPAALGGRAAPATPSAPVSTPRMSEPRTKPTLPVATAGTPAPAPADVSARSAAKDEVTGLLAGDLSEATIQRFREALTAEIKRTRPASVYNMLFAQVQRVDVSAAGVTFIFARMPKFLASQFEVQRPSLVELASRLAGRAMTVRASEELESAGGAVEKGSEDSAKDRLKAAALSEPAVQALLDVLPAEIRDVEEMK
jgi:DNA polymerase III subunit gamma/tau